MSTNGNSSVDLCDFLEATRIEGTPYSNVGVYSLVPKESPVTFYSQQIRAFNFVAALNTCAKGFGDEKGDPIKVAVVGAGLAGITAASALVMLKNRNIQVTVYERAPCNFPEQRFNTSRHIHPRILFWPEHNFENASTELPYLNWSEGMCNEIVRGLDDQFKMLEYYTNTSQEKIDPTSNGPLTMRYNTHVKGYFISDSGYVLNVAPVGSEGGDLVSEAYHYIIFTVGFGTEKVLNNVLGYTYWQNDPYSQIVYQGNSTIAVSGTGDGALTDFIRLAFVDFDHGEILRKVTQRLQRAPKLIEALTKANHDFIRDAGNEGDGATGPRRGAAAIALWNAFTKNDLAREVNIKTIGKIREGASLTLIGTGPLPMERGASLLNRIITYCLLQCGIEDAEPKATETKANPAGVGQRFSYFQGKVKEAERVATGTILHFESRLENRPRLHFNHVIIRHGADPVISDVAPTWNPSQTYSAIISNAGKALAKDEVQEAVGTHDLVKRERRAALQAGAAHLVPVLKSAVISCLYQFKKVTDNINYRFSLSETDLSDNVLKYNARLCVFKKRNAQDNSLNIDQNLCDSLKSCMTNGKSLNDDDLGKDKYRKLGDIFTEKLKWNLPYTEGVNDSAKVDLSVIFCDEQKVVDTALFTYLGINELTEVNDLIGKGNAGNERFYGCLTFPAIGRDLSIGAVVPAHIVNILNDSDNQLSVFRNNGVRFDAGDVTRLTYPLVNSNYFDKYRNMHNIGVLKIPEYGNERDHVNNNHGDHKISGLNPGVVYNDKLVIRFDGGKIECTVDRVNCYIEGVSFDDKSVSDKEYTFDGLFKIKLNCSKIILAGAPVFTDYGRIIGMIIARSRHEESCYYVQELAPALKAIGYTLVQDT